MQLEVPDLINRYPGIVSARPHHWDLNDIGRRPRHDIVVESNYHRLVVRRMAVDFPGVCYFLTIGMRNG